MVEPKNILIIRLSAIGDIVFSSPLIKALRRNYPRAKICWLVESMSAPLLKNNPEIDEVIICPRLPNGSSWRERSWLSFWREATALRKRLKDKHFDMAIDLQGLMKSAVWAWLSGADQRIGLGSREWSDRLMTRVISREDETGRIGAEYYKLAQALDLDVTRFDMDIALSAEDESFPGAVIVKQAYAVICPFTTRPQKHWVEGRWAQLAEQIQTQLGLSVIMLGGPADQAVAENIVAANDGIMNMAGKASLTQSAAMIKHASLLVGVDTGLTHMGIAFNVPTITLFGSTCPYTNTTRDNAYVLYHKLDCSPCRRNPTCGGAFTCMKLITVEEVMQHIREFGV